MDSIIFIRKYESYLDEIHKVVKPEYQSVIEDLLQNDPHDLVTPDTWFNDASGARGLVWTLFLIKVRDKERAIDGGK
ncbi:MAG: hypothetical protein FD181_996 [Prolixibacteraceae bacterium]|nr:MAG: hypothetical protein FD181_996 [Prolixibacteraceae bacterium]